MGKPGTVGQAITNGILGARTTFHELVAHVIAGGLRPFECGVNRAIKITKQTPFQRSFSWSVIGASLVDSPASSSFVALVCLPRSQILDGTGGTVPNLHMFNLVNSPDSGFSFRWNSAVPRHMACWIDHICNQRRSPWVAGSPLTCRVGPESWASLVILSKVSNMIQS